MPPDPPCLSCLWHSSLALWHQYYTYNYFPVMPHQGKTPGTAPEPCIYICMKSFLLKASKHNLLWFSVSKRSSTTCQKTSYSIPISLTSKSKHSVKYKDLLHSYRSLNISGECGNTNLTIFKLYSRLIQFIRSGQSKQTVQLNMLSILQPE